MKKLILILLFFLTYGLSFSQELLSEKWFDDAYRYTGINPRNATVINDTTIFFAIFIDNYTDGTCLKLCICNRYFYPKWIASDSLLPLISSPSLSFSNNKYNYYGTIAYKQSATAFYRHITIDTSGNIAYKFTSNYGNRLYSLGGLSFNVLDNNNCFVAKSSTLYSELVCFDSLDSLKWRTTLDTFPNNNLTFLSTPLIAKGKLISIGPAKCDTIGSDYHNIYFLRTDLMGNVEEKKFYGGVSDYIGISVSKQVKDSLFAFCYTDNDTTRLSKLVFFNFDGDSLYEKSFGKKGVYTKINDMKLLRDGALLAFGYTVVIKNQPDSSKQFYAVKFSPQGEILWEKTWGDYGLSDELTTCVELDSGKYTIIGASKNLLYKCVLTDAINSVNEPATSESELKISPNPAGNTLKIENASDYDKIEIFDIRGELVATFSSAQELDISRLSAGAYNIKAYSGNKTQNGRFVKK